MKFTHPWPVVPSVIVTPTNVQTVNTKYSQSSVSIRCYADSISKSGFRVHAYSEVSGAHGSSEISPTNIWEGRWQVSRTYGSIQKAVSKKITINLPIKANKIRLYGTFRLLKGNSDDVGGTPHMSITRGNDRVTVTCGGKQTYSGAFLDRNRCPNVECYNKDPWTGRNTKIGPDPADNLPSGARWMIESCEFISNEFPVVYGQPVVIDVSIEAHIYQESAYGEDCWGQLIARQVDCDVVSNEVLDPNGECAFYVMADVNKYYALTK